MKGRAGAYLYGFNGKEEDSSGEWGSKSHYDYGFRIYNPSIAKFLSVDPLAADYPWYTPYQFAGNNPIRFVDLDGLEEYDPFPDAYYRDAPKIPMTDGPRSNLNADKHPRSARYFWRRMMEDAPHMLCDDNKASIRAGRHVDIKVDDKWIE
ncbi:RHS repeat domain-containing protein [Lunatimonas salinarum]|uniref:RHS repeat domain-containing protein n=1 Tax=Lunatimonas salinarum TaxID=1774590 RepID=UPI001FD7A169|nr:RHS repeat-associated core domain-containing protein [Lunatimonas salinarum]